MGILESDAAPLHNGAVRRALALAFVLAPGCLTPQWAREEPAVTARVHHGPSDTDIAFSASGRARLAAGKGVWVEASLAPDAPEALAIHGVEVQLFGDRDGNARLDEGELAVRFSKLGAPSRTLRVFGDAPSMIELAAPCVLVRVLTTQDPVAAVLPLGD